MWSEFIFLLLKCMPNTRLQISIYVNGVVWRIVLRFCLTCFVFLWTTQVLLRCGFMAAFKCMRKRQRLTTSWILCCQLWQHFRELFICTGGRSTFLICAVQLWALLQLSKNFPKQNGIWLVTKKSQARHRQAGRGLLTICSHTKWSNIWTGISGPWHLLFLNTMHGCPYLLVVEYNCLLSRP